MTQFISEDEAMARMADPNNLANLFGPHRENPESHVAQSPGGTEQDPVVVEPEVVEPARRRKLLPFERVIIGLSAHTHTTRDVAAAFGVHPETVARLKQGKNTHTDKVDPELKKALDSSLERINNVAVDRLLRVMGAITDDKVGEIKTAREASEVAKNIATVIDKTTPKQQGGNATAQVIIMTPPSQPMKEYEKLEAPIPDA